MSVEIQKDKSLIISGFDGIGNSTISDFSDILGVNTFNNPGVASVNLRFNKVMETMEPVTFTVTTDRVVTQAPFIYRGNEDYIPVTLTTTGTLPTGLATNTIYYTEKTGTNTYKLKNTIKGSGYVSFSAGTGSGVHTLNPITPKAIKNGCWTTNSQGRIFALDTDNNLWFLDGDGVSSPWYLLDGNTSAGFGNAVVYYKGYILVIGNAKIDALKDMQSITADTITWTNDFVTGTISAANLSANRKLFLSVNDDSIYFVNGSVTGRYHRIAMLEEVADKVFDPTDSSTFSFVADATTIPFEDSIGATVISEINEYLIIGTGGNKVYFWDKKSPSFTSFITLQEEFVSDIQVIDNIAYIFAGKNGSVYVANLSSSKLLFTLPQQFTDEYYTIYDINVYSSAVYKREILFSVSFSKTDSVAYNYLMSYNIDTKKLIKKNISSFGETSERNGLFFGRIYSIFVNVDNVLLSSSSFDISDDKYTYAGESLLYVASTETGTPTYYVYNNYEPNIITGLILVGQPFSKATFREIHASFLRNLATGQGIKVYYRYDDDSAWTLLKTIDYTTFGAIKDIKVEAPITDIVDLQIKIELAGSNLTSPRLKFIKLIP